MQVVWDYPEADDAYVSGQGWEKATLAQCPYHPGGECRPRRHGTYARVSPAGTRIARWICPKASATISLLPAFLAAKWSGTLEGIEAVVAKVEEIGMGAALEIVRPSTVENAIGLSAAWRWTRRRVVAVQAVLLALVTLLPALFEGVAPTVRDVRAHLGTTQALRRSRELLARHHGALPVPLGFRARARG